MHGDSGKTMHAIVDPSINIDRHCLPILLTSANRRSIILKRTFRLAELTLLVRRVIPKVNDGQYELASEALKVEA